MEEKHSMKIAICDDEKEIRSSIEINIRKTYADIDMIQFEDGKALLEYAGQIDILFLDIQMQPISGMETAEALRKNGNQAIIIFVTALEEYVFEAFDVGAFHYLLKPFSEEKFQEVLERAISQYENNRNLNTEPEAKSIMIKSGNSHRKIKIEDIIFAEVFNRKVVIHTTEGNTEYYGKLTELQKKVGDDFFRPHRAYLVNFRYVERYDIGAIYLEKGQALMAKQNYSEFVKRFLQYNRKEG